ncbi:U-exon [Barthadenovirus sternae]|uniref:UXP n=1 Tax=Tern adenovirus TaxID=2820437 RepID=A0A8K1KUY3_9ADEN|nr:UXP [Tern adenovirus]UJZ92517.1 U-exon [Tern atadenovirus 1]
MTDIYLNSDKILSFNVILPKTKWIKIAKRNNMCLESYPTRVIFYGATEDKDILM